MRIFVAIPVPSALQNEITKWRESLLRSQLSFAKATEGAMRWLKDKNLHITLIPPWEEKEGSVNEVLARLKAAVGTAAHPMDCTFTKVRFGPDPHRPRLVWAEGDAPAALTALVYELHKTLDIPETRPFRLHLTLARFRPERFAAFSMRQLDETVSWRMEASLIVLMRSHLLPAGAEYEVLGEVPFTA